MGSLFYQAKTYVCLSHPFFLFSTTSSCYCCRFIYFYTDLKSSYFIHLFRFLFALWCVFSYLLAYACVCEHFISLFSSRRHMFPCIISSHIFLLFFIVCLCELSTQNVIYVDKNEDDDNSSSD